MDTESIRAWIALPLIEGEGRIQQLFDDGQEEARAAAHASLRAYAATEPHPRALFYLFRLCMSTRERTAMEEVYRRLVEAVPDAVETCIARGMLADVDGRVGAAHAAYCAAAETAPEDPYAVLVLESFFRRWGKKLWDDRLAGLGQTRPEKAAGAVVPLRQASGE